MTVEMEEMEERLRQSAVVLDRKVTVEPRLHRRIMEGTVHRSVARQRQRLPVRRWSLALAAALLVLLNLPAAYFLPSYARALAGAPFLGVVSGAVLKGAGLDATAISPLSGSATSSGHTLRVIGGYADPGRTVLFVEVDGKAVTPPSKTAKTYYLDGDLVDQFGHHYNRHYTANASLEFDPLVWPATSVGARLTLHVNALLYNLGPQGNVNGDWNVHLLLFQQKAHFAYLPLPAPVTRGGVQYRITSIQLSYYSIVMRWTVSGPPVDAFRRQVAQPQASSPSTLPVDPDFIGVDVFDSAGNEVVTFNGWGATVGKNGVDLSLDGALPGPGRYTIQFGHNDLAVRQEIDVPAQP